MADDFMAWLDEWVEEQLPSDVISRLIEEERAHAAAFTKEFGRFAVQFEAMYSAHVRLLDDVNFIDKSTWPPHRAVQYVLLSYNAKTLYSAFDRLMRGHYEDSLALIRGLYETFVRALWVSAYPSVAYNVLVAKPPEGRQFNLTNFLRDDLKLERETNYGVLSAFAHSNSHAVLQALIRAAEQEGEPERFDTHVRFDQKSVELVGPLLLFVLLGHLRLVVDLLVGDIPPRDADRMRVAREALQALTRMVRENPKDYWQRVANDMDWLFVVLASADRGEEWKDLVKARR